MESLIVFGLLGVLMFGLVKLLQVQVLRSLPPLQKGFLYVVGVFGIFVLVGVIMMQREGRQQRLREDQFRAEEQEINTDRGRLAPHVKEFAAMTNLEKSSATDAAYVIGKVLIIDEKTSAIDHSWERLPKELRATRAEEVGTVVLVNCAEIFKGSKVYELRSRDGTVRGSEPIYESECNVIIIDVASQRVVGKTTLRETSEYQLHGPPVVPGRVSDYEAKLFADWATRPREQVHAPRPSFEAYVEQLPRKTSQ